MSKLLEKKDIIHITTEIVVLIGITFYFSSKNKKLLDHIEDLSKRIEEQEDIVQKHEKIIMQLVQNINNQNNQNINNQNNQNINNQNIKPTTRNQTQPVKKQLVVKEQNSKKINQSPIKVVFKDDEIQQQKRSNILIEEENDDESDESDLDEEIAEELQELYNDDIDDGLKKRI